MEKEEMGLKKRNKIIISCIATDTNGSYKVTYQDKTTGKLETIEVNK